MINLITKLGKKIINFLVEFGQIVLLLISIIKYFPRAIKDKKLVLDQMKIVGADSLPLVILIGVFTGAIAALEATDLFIKFNLIGLAKPYIGASIATAVFTELTPVLTALVIAGRVGGSMAAEIGTMNVTEQIDALEMMAIDKSRFLAMPRMLATLLMMPMLAIFSDLVAIIGGYILTLIQFDFSFVMFFESVQRFFRESEIVIGLSKSIMFGGVTALIGCHVGFRTVGGAEGVGSSTVRAYTLSAAAILIIDALFGYLV
jgi:phospholipid/cholesterol/gamma-HCH transport system permease protein